MTLCNSHWPPPRRRSLQSCPLQAHGSVPRAGLPPQAWLPLVRSPQGHCQLPEGRPFLPRGSLGPSGVADPGAGTPRQPAVQGWQRPGAGVGRVLEPDRTRGFAWPLPPTGTLGGWGPWWGPRGSCHLAAGTVLPAEQQQQRQEQQEEDEQGDEPPEGAGRAVWGRGERKGRRRAVLTPGPGSDGPCAPCPGLPAASSPFFLCTRTVLLGPGLPSPSTV